MQRQVSVLVFLVRCGECSYERRAKEERGAERRGEREEGREEREGKRGEREERETKETAGVGKKQTLDGGVLQQNTKNFVISLGT